MTEQTEQSRPEAGTDPIQAALQNLIEAVSRSVSQTLTAEDDVSGYSLIGQAGPLALGRPLVVVYCPAPPAPGVRPIHLPGTLSQTHG
jgi:hypothetical protein